MIAPGRSLVLLCALPAVASFLLLFHPALTDVVLAVDLLVAVLALIDIWTLPSKRRLGAERSCATTLSLGEIHQVEVTVDNRSRRPLLIEVRDDRAPTMRVEPDEFAMVAPPRARAVLHYTLTPERRGSYPLEFVYVRATSRWGLWRRHYRLPVHTLLRVYPDLKQISRYALYARQNRLSLLGVRKTRRVGTDNEFERLRDYTPDDNFKNIDWRTTARHRRLIVRDFQANHSQRIVLMIDAGRMMVNETGNHSLLDHALDAMLMLAHVSLARHDQVGLLTFSDAVHDWIPLGAGPRRINRLVHAAHDLFPRLVESRFDLAFMHLAKHCRKRTLVILITNLIDQVNYDQVESHLTNLVGRHLPLGVLLRDHELFSAVPPDGAADGAQLFEAAAAADILSWRNEMLGNLRHKGALTMDVFPAQLTAQLINEYLRIKALHLL